MLLFLGEKMYSFFFQSLGIRAEADSVYFHAPDSFFISVGEPVFVEVKNGIGRGEWLWIILCLLFIVFVSWAAIRIWKKNHNIKLLIWNLESANARNKISFEVIAGLIEDRELLVRSLMEQDRSIESSGKNLPLLEYVEKLQGVTDRYHRLVMSLREDKRYFYQLEKAVDVAKEEVVSRTRKLFGQKYSEDDYKLIVGFFAGLSPVTLSFMTGLRPGTIRVKKSRFKDRIEALPPSAEKDLLLKGLD